MNFRAFTLAKYPSDPAPNEDAYAIDRMRGRVALSDGASESFDSARWARALVDHFICSPHVDSGWLHSACARYGATHDRAALSWSAQAAYDRGSFATLVGITIHRDGGFVSVLGIGDSLAVLADGHAVVDTFPYTDAEEFQRRPLLLCTAESQNREINTGNFRRRFFRNWTLSKLQEPTVLCMTDALGAWFLSDPNKRLSVLLRIKAQDQFERFVTHERSNGRMKRDDTTIVRVS